MLELSPGSGIWRQLLPLPPDHPHTVSIYAIEDSAGDLHVVDAGWASTANRWALRSALDHLAARPRVRTVIITHHHADHLGSAAWIRRLTGAQLLMHPNEQRVVDDIASGRSVPMPDALDRLGVPDAEKAAIVDDHRAARRRHRHVRADALTVDGTRLAVPGRDIELLHTPGHTAGHLCVVDHASGSVFTGDHVLPGATPGIGLGGDLGPNPLATYFDSLERIGRLEGYTAYPAHGDPFRSIEERTRQIRARLLRRSGDVADVVAQRPHATPWDVATSIRWSRPWRLFSGEVKSQALTQTLFHMLYLDQNRG